jgi:hypothetical protein
MEGLVMVARNKTVFGLLVVAIVSGVVAVRGATQAQAAGNIIPNALCASRVCNTLTWGNPPTDDQGNPLPVGTTCTMGMDTKSLCITNPSTNCNSAGTVQNGCAGSYTLPGDPNVFYICYQAINKC